VNIFSYIRKQSLFQDRRAIWLLVIGLILLVLEILYTVVNITHRELKVPVRYSGYYDANLIQSGEWYTLYVLPLFSTVVYTVNTILAMRIHILQKGAAVALLALSVVILIFALLVTRALLGLN